ncbi:MAG: hypothetical protein R2932_20370 [Caldilineaceae bacterium]
MPSQLIMSTKLSSSNSLRPKRLTMPTTRTMPYKGVSRIGRSPKNGDGKNINMRIPVNTVTGSIDGFDFELDSAKLIVQVNLEYIPADPQEDENASVTSLNLKIKNKSANPDIPVVSLVTGNLDSTPTGQGGNRNG